MDERNKINTTWIEKTKQISDILTKAQASPNIILKLDIAKLKHELYDLLLKQLIKKQTNVEQCSRDRKVSCRTWNGM